LRKFRSPFRAGVILREERPKELSSFSCSAQESRILRKLRMTLALTGPETYGTLYLGDQFDYLDGDAFAVDLPAAAYDLAILANFCHLFGEPENRALLGRLVAALRPGGRLAIVDAVPNERFDSPRPVMLYALGLLLRTSRGEV